MTRGYFHGLAALEPHCGDPVRRIARHKTNRGMINKKKIEAGLVLRSISLIGRRSFIFIAGSLPDRLSWRGII